MNTYIGKYPSQIQCQCGCIVKREVSNLLTKKEGVEINLIACVHYHCKCGKIILPKNIKDLVIDALHEKKRKFPKSSPYLYINVFDICPSKE